MPEEAIKTLTTQLALGPTNWTMKILLQLKYRFGVNAETFAHRLEKLGVLAPALYSHELSIGVKPIFFCFHVQHAEKRDKHAQILK